MLNHNLFCLSVEKSVESRSLSREQKVDILCKIFKDISSTEILHPYSFLFDKIDEIDELAEEREADCIALSTEERIRNKQIELGIEPDSPEDESIKLPYGRTRLHEAVVMQDEQMVRLFISEDDDSFSEDNNGNTPYDLALLNNNKDMILLLESLDAAQ